MNAAAALLTLTASLFPLAAAAQTTSDAVLRLTLEDALGRGLGTSHRVAEAIARSEATGARVGQRRAAGLPQVQGQGGYTRTNHVETFGILSPDNQLRVIYPDIPDNFRARLDVQWPIYTGGRVEAFERMARIEADASLDEVATARADLTLEITRAFWALVTAREALRVVEEAVRRIDAHLLDARNQLAAGLVPPSDVLRVEAQQSRQRMLTIQAGASRDVAEAELARLVGAPGGTSIDPAVALDLPPGDGPNAVPYPSGVGAALQGGQAADAFAALVAGARERRPERAALARRVDATGEGERAAAAATRPTIAVAGGFDYARPNARIFPRQGAWNTSWDAGVNVAVPIFDGGRARSEIAEAAASARAARARLADLDAAIAVEVRQRLSEVVSSRAAIDAATDAVRSATEARRVIGERFAAGVAISTDVLDAQVTLLQAELDRTQAVASARLADARLTRALGQ